MRMVECRINAGTMSAVSGRQPTNPGRKEGDLCMLQLLFSYPRFCLPDGAGWVWRAGGALYHTGRVPAMSASSLSDRIVHLAATPVLVGHPVVAGLVV